MFRRITGDNMAKLVVMDEFIVTVSVPHNLTEDEYRAIRRTLIGKQLLDGLQRAIRDQFRQHPTLTKVRIAVTR